MKVLNIRVFLVSGLLLVAIIGGFGGATFAQGPTATPFGPVIGGASPTPEQSPSPTPPLPTLRSEMMGIQVYANIEINFWQAIVDRATFMGMKWLKAQVNWKELEFEKGVFSPQTSIIGDNLVYAGRRGFKIMISVVNAPDWARPPEARGKLEGPPADPKELGDFITRLLDRWGTEYINAIEVWNEPNLLREWTGVQRGGAIYKRYFDAAYAAIRAKSPNIIVLTAGPAPAGDTPDGSVNDRTWLRELYQAGLPVADPNFAIGIHPYGWANPPDARCCASPSQGWDDQRFFFFLDNIAEYRQIMVENGHTDGKLWATEFGWATFKGLKYRDHINGPPALPPVEPALAWMNRLTEEQQAHYIIRAFELAQTGELAGFMGPMMLWNMNFAALKGYVKENEPSLPEAGFSVVNTDFANRPAYELLEKAPKQ